MSKHGERRGPWVYSDGEGWWPKGWTLSGTDAWNNDYRWTCYSLTGQDEPPEPEWILVAPAQIDPKPELPVERGCDWAWLRCRVQAWPVTVNGTRLWVWLDSRGVLRTVDRE